MRKVIYSQINSMVMKYNNCFLYQSYSKRCISFGRSHNRSELGD